MRRLLRLLVLTAIVGTAAACDAAPSMSSGSPWARITADQRFECGVRSLEGDAAPERAAGVRSSLDLSTFACRFAGSYGCVLWVSSVGGRQEYWTTARGPERERIIGALGDALDWPAALVTAVAGTGDARGRLGAAEWYLGFGGALVVDIDDPSPVT